MFSRSADLLNKVNELKHNWIYISIEGSGPNGCVTLACHQICNETPSGVPASAYVVAVMVARHFPHANFDQS